MRRNRSNDSLLSCKQQAPQTKVFELFSATSSARKHTYLSSLGGTMYSCWDVGVILCVMQHTPLFEDM